MSEPIRDHYEAYPYPSRDPGEEKNRLVTGSPSHLSEVNHYLFDGARDFSKPFRALVAGGGTGDATVMLAQQLADAGPAGEVVYLDLSHAAAEVAQARVRARGLSNVSFHRAGIAELPGLGLAPFDYIDCCGVLHHLPDPTEGLRILAGSLAPGGGMGLMLYGRFGRRGVYEMQSMLRRLSGMKPPAARLDLARRLLDALPRTNWLKRNPFLGDHKRGDAELADLLLHPLDRPFQVSEIAELTADAGLEIVSFIEAIRYEPSSYIKDPRLLKAMGSLSVLERAAFSEELAGNIKTHVFYVTNAPATTEAQPDGPDVIPCLKSYDGKELARACGRNLLLKVEFDGLPLGFALPRLTPLILERIDNATPLGQIHDQLRALDPGLDWEDFLAQFQDLHRVLRGLNQLLLRRPHTKS